MPITSLLKENWKEDNLKLQEAISLLKKSRTANKIKRKSEWKSLRNSLVLAGIKLRNL